MAAHRRCLLWALSTVLCASALLLTGEAGRLVSEQLDPQPPPSLVSAPTKRTPIPRREGSSGGSTSANTSDGANPMNRSTPQGPSSTNRSQLNQPPPFNHLHDRPPQSLSPVPGNVPSQLPQMSKAPPTNEAPPLLSPPPPSVPDPPVPVSASPPPTGKQEQPPGGPRSDATPSGNPSRKDGSRDGGDKKDDNSSGWTSVGQEKFDKCSGIHFKCTFPLDGCIMSSQNDHRGFLYLRNTGENSVNMTVSVPSSTKTVIQGLPKNGIGQIPVSIDAKDIPKLIIKTGRETCVPFPKDASTSGLFKQFQSYTAQMTPIYGAYAFFLTALIAGGAWACCSFARRGRRRVSGVPYQQLEMGGIQSHPNDLADGTLENTADGWEQGWDDDWDDEEAVSGPQSSGNPSTNGIPLNSTNKDGWEDWDD